MKRRPYNAILRAGVIAALEQGEATAAEIELRMGVTFNGDSALAAELRNLVRQRIARRIGSAIVDGRRFHKWVLAPT